MKRRSDQSEQWKLIEHIVAALFDDSDVEVQRNVRLPAIRRQGGRGGRREIDVLLTGRLASQRIHIPIECKHHRKKVGSPDIDAFIGKLQDVGLPTQTSIFVSTSGFAAPAIARAQEAGMKTLVLSGADVSRTRDLIFEAIQSLVYVGCQLSRLEFQTDSELQARDLQFFDGAGKFKGSLPDLLWQAWVNGVPPLICGHHRYDVEVPEAWRYHLDGSPSSTRNIRVEYKVFALVNQFRGEARSLRLTDARTEKVERQTIQVSFAETLSEPAPMAFESEAELEQFLSSRPGGAQITVGRMRLPKILTNEGILWPLPSDAIERLSEIDPSTAKEEFAKLRESAVNNFWDFDGVYAEILNESQGGTWVRMRALEGPS